MSIEKRFPANTTLQDATFLNDKKINAELYAYLQSISRPDGNGNTYVLKKDMPSQAEICRKIGLGSPKTLRVHMAYLIASEYLIEDSKGYILPDREDIFMFIPLETVKFLVDTLKDQVVKIYIYLGQRYRFKPGYEFTLEELGEHIGIKLHNNGRNYELLNNALNCLRNNGLIDYEDFYDGRFPKKRLTQFSLRATIR